MALKSIFIYIVITIILVITNIAKAENLIGFGFHIGAEHNVGNISSYDPDIIIDPQNNYLLGFSCKSNFYCFFSRIGLDTSFLINRGEVLENSSNEIESLRIHYTSIPLFIGFNYKVLDVGNFYMGPGFSYIIGRGRIVCTSSFLSEDIDTNVWGYGFIAGIELNLTSSVRFCFEWEYMDARSQPIQQTQSDHNWKNFYVA